MIANPSFATQWMLSLHRTPNGGYFLRLTKKGRNRIVLPSAEQRADAPGTVRTERAIDSRTAHLFAELWKALVGRTQFVHSDGAVFDGVRYYLWRGGSGGTTVSPRAGSILERATSAAQRLAHMVEEPSSRDEDILAILRDDLRDALARTRRKEACVQPYRE